MKITEVTVERNASSQNPSVDPIFMKRKFSNKSLTNIQMNSRTKKF